MTNTTASSRLRPAWDFQPDQKARAQIALERLAFAYDETTEVERRDDAEGTSFVVWASATIDLPDSVLGYKVTVRVGDEPPTLLI